MITTLLLIIIYLAFISLGLPDTILGSAWPAIYQEIGVPDSYAGVIFMIVSAGTITSSFFSEKIINRLGTGLVTFISVLMTALALVGISFGNHFFVFCVMAIPLGLGAGSVDAALNNYVALHFAARHMNWLHCFWGVGATAGPVIMSLFLDVEKGTGNWKTGYRTIGIIQLALVAVLFLALPLWKKAESDQEGAGSKEGNRDNESIDDNERKGKYENKGSNESVESSENIGGAESKAEAKEEKTSIKMSEVFGLPGAKTVLVSFFCYCAIEATMGLWGSSYLVFAKGISAETAAKWVAVFYFGITFGRFLAGFLSMKVNNRNMIRIGEILIGLGMLCLLLPMGSSLLQIGFLLTGIGCAPIYPSMLHETPVSFGSKYSQALIGIQMAFAYVGNIAMPPLFGFLASHITYGLLPLFLTVLLILMVVMVEASKKAGSPDSVAH